MENKNKIQIPVQHIEQKIHLIRGIKIMLDSDLAELFGVETRVLTQAMKRNIDRFPEDFMFQLTTKEWDVLRSQIETSKKGHGGRRYPPYAFTEHGATMLASVLKSKRAVEVSILVVRAFMRLREILTTHKEITRKLTELERKLTGHDRDIKMIFDAINQLMKPLPSNKRKIGFERKDKSK